MHDYWMYGNGYGAWDFVWNLFMMALVVVVIIFLVRYLVRTPKTGTEGRNEAIEILKKRYAQGEIDKKEYEDKLKDLNQ